MKNIDYTLLPQQPNRTMFCLLMENDCIHRVGPETTLNCLS